MSRFLSEKHSGLVPYTPGEQPKNRKYIKLNTNESPFPPSEKAMLAAADAARMLNLYSDPESRMITEKIAAMADVEPECVLVTNGSDEILNFAFMAFCDEKTPAVFPDITYGFYPVFAELNGIPYIEIPLKDDFSINISDYFGSRKTIFIANPNAPTGILLSTDDIEKIIQANPDNIVVIDEAYIDFGGKSSIPLIKKYDNLLVTRTFSKSRSMAGARLGFGVGCPEIIKDLNMIKYSTNPYNVNSMTAAAGIGSLSDEDYTIKNCNEIIRVRDYTVGELKKLGFCMTDSCANFIFARSPEIFGGELNAKLKERGILVRHFKNLKISDYNRITIGTYEQMKILVDTIKSILEEER